MVAHGDPTQIRKIPNLPQIRTRFPKGRLTNGRYIVGLLVNITNQDDHEDVRKILKIFQHLNYGQIIHGIRDIGLFVFDIDQFTNVVINGQFQQTRKKHKFTQT